MTRSEFRGQNPGLDSVDLDFPFIARHDAGKSGAGVS